MPTIEETLNKLQSSAFRARFKLRAGEREYIRAKGMDVIENHARTFVAERLAPAYIPNDGRQTPMRGHPVFIAQHACACCCRGCLSKWYRVPPGRALTQIQQDKIVNLLMAWIKRECETADEPQKGELEK